MSKVFFISGIDTDCGKTYITGKLAKSLLKKQQNLITQKIIQSGCEGISEDILAHRKEMGVDLFEEDINGTTCPYVFKYASSPHLAARLENVIVDMSFITKATQKLSKKYDIVLLEGVGGLAVPITPDVLVLDYIAQQNYPLILVGSSQLGSINHSILSIKACKQNGIDLHTFVFNIFPNADENIAESSAEYIKNYLAQEYPNAQFVTNNNIDLVVL